MNIQVSEAPKRNLLGGPENMKTELKTSIFFAAGEQTPGVRQYYKIAKTIAGFINGEGGVLWLGVEDGGAVKGIEQDLAVLGGGLAAPCRGPLSNDTGLTFGGTADQYILKLKELVKALIGPSAEKYIAGTQAATVDGKIVVKVPVTKADPGYYAYVYKWHPSSTTYTEDLYQRVANGTSSLEGFARDNFIKGKCREEFEKQLRVLKDQLAALQQNAGGLSKTELMAALEELQSKVTVGAPVIVSGALSIADPNFGAIKSPRKFVFDGEHVCDVKTWKDAFGALLVKLNELNAAKFDDIASEPFFGRWFVQVQRHKRYSDYYKTLLGSGRNIRGLSKVGKSHFTNPDYVVHRLLARFGIDPSRVAYAG